MKIGNRSVGLGSPTYIIGEVGLAHDGSIDRAHDYVDAIADTGASAVKFQCYTKFDPNEPWRVGQRHRRYYEETRWAYRKRVAFGASTYAALATHCRDRKVDFLCSVFDLGAFEIIDPLVGAHKVASGQITNTMLLQAMRNSDKPVLLSTGMATYWEIQEAKSYLVGVPVAVLQCTSMYPTSPGDIGLGSLLEGEAGLVWGLSDHSGTIYAGLAACALGASIIEVHIKLSSNESGPDASSSITPEKLYELVEGCAFIREALRPINKDVMASQLDRTRSLFLHKSKVVQ